VGDAGAEHSREDQQKLDVYANEILFKHW
jgi:fructose-1,6-bisphosphatase